MAEELTTRSPRVADRSLCLLPTDVTGQLRSLGNRKGTQPVKSAAAVFEEFTFCA